MLSHGTKVWVRGSQLEWRDGTVEGVVGHSANSIAVRLSETNQLTVVSRTKVFVENRTENEDITSLESLDEPSILNNLEQRSLKNLPYTFLGPVLIIVNPVIDIGDPPLRRSKNMVGGLQEPHPFSIAEQAYSQMQLAARLQEVSHGGKEPCDHFISGYKPHQTIVIAGESGSGKTEAAKRVLRCLAARSTPDSQANSAEELLKANVVFESFGNAYTQSNPNSSRFGKLTRLFFLQSNLRGSSFQTYLLERSRVTSIQSGERNFHIFYRMAFGASDCEREGLGLPAADLCSEYFRILRPLDALKDSEMPKLVSEDIRSYKNLSGGLSSIGISKCAQFKLLKVLAAILHLGNITFDDQDGVVIAGDCMTYHSHLPPDFRSVSPLERAAILLETSESSLKAVLLEKRMIIAGEQMKSLRTAEQAGHARDALIRAVYEAVFNWIVKEANTHFSNPQSEGLLDGGQYIAVLDIFGFESFSKNSLEQLLINFANESLQRTFHQHVLVAEANLYKTEGLVINDSDFPVVMEEHSKCLALLVGKGGLLPLIDDFSSTPQPTDDKLLQYMRKVFSENSCFEKPLAMHARDHFVISHFAGSVAYNISDFVQKNTDKVPLDVVEHLNKSADKVVVAELFSPKRVKFTRLASIRDASISNLGRREARGNGVGLCSAFANEIKSLIADLDKTNCTFIRCIKPNKILQRSSDKKWFDRSYVAKQLVNLMIPQTATVLGAGRFPLRISYQSLYNLYLPQLALDNYHFSSCTTEETVFRDFTKAFLWSVGLDQSTYKAGLSRVFFKKQAINIIQEFICSTQTDPVALAALGLRMKKHRAVLRWKKCIRAVQAFEAFVSLSTKLRLQKAEACICHFLSGKAVRYRFTKLKCSTVTIQTAIRCMLAVKMLKRMKSIESSRIIDPVETPYDCDTIFDQQPENKEDDLKSCGEDIADGVGRTKNNHHSHMGNDSFPQPTVETNLTSPPVVVELQMEIAALKTQLLQMQKDQQNLIQIVTESQKREQMIVDEHFRTLRLLADGMNSHKNRTLSRTSAYQKSHKFLPNESFDVSNQKMMVYTPKEQIKRNDEKRDWCIFPW